MLSSSPGYLLWARLHSPDSTGGDICAVRADSGPVFLCVPLLWELWGWDASETEEERRLPTRLLHGHTNHYLCLPRVSLPHLQRVFVTIYNKFIHSTCLWKSTVIHERHEKVANYEFVQTGRYEVMRLLVEIVGTIQ